MSTNVSFLGFSFDRTARAPTVWGLLLAGTAVSWSITWRAASEMSRGPGTMGLSLAAFMPMWVAMMAAMMLPAVASSMYLRGVKIRASRWSRATGVAQLFAGYLGVWSAFGLVAFAAAWEAGLLAEHHARVALYSGAGLLLASGLYQLTPLKEACLRHCRSPFALLLQFGNYKGPARDLRVGIVHGGFCLGCCWGLMVVLVAVGVMNVAWMAVLAAVIFLEKTWRYGKALGIAFGIGLIVLALFVPSHPFLVPGLHGRMGMTMGMAR